MMHLMLLEQMLGVIYLAMQDINSDINEKNT